MSESSKSKIEWIKFILLDIGVGVVAALLEGLAWFFYLLGLGIYCFVLKLLFTDLNRNRKGIESEKKDIEVLKTELDDLKEYIDKYTDEIKQGKSKIRGLLEAEERFRECVKKRDEHYEAIDQYIEKIKLVKWKIGCVFLGICILGIVIVSQNYETIRSVYKQLTIVETRDEQKETGTFTEAEETEETESETYVPSVEPGQVISYNTKCEMKLNIDELTGSLSNDELDELFLGLFYIDISGMSDDEIYERVKIRLSGLCDVQKEGVLEDAPVEVQDEVWDISKEEKEFFDSIQEEKERPSYLPGTETWYMFLPESEKLTEIISKREEFMESCPDGHIAEGLFGDYFYMGKELKKQECDKNVIQYYYEKAGLWCVRELKFKDDTLWGYEIKHEKTMQNLRNVFNALSDYEKSFSGVLYKMVGRYMAEKGWKVE